MSARFHPAPVTPTGTQRCAAFVDYADGTGELVVGDGPVYPPSPQGERLRAARVERELSLGDTARASGLSVVQVSELERGRCTLPEAEWTALLALVATAERSGQPTPAARSARSTARRGAR